MKNKKPVKKLSMVKKLEEKSQLPPTTPGTPMPKVKPPKKEESKKKDNTAVRRVYVRLKKTAIYRFAVNVAVEENSTEENNKAVELAWNVINQKLIDPNSVQVGDAFQTEVIKKELMKNN